jgi:hypothetical protein
MSLAVADRKRDGQRANPQFGDAVSQLNARTICKFSIESSLLARFAMLIGKAGLIFDRIVKPLAEITFALPACDARTMLIE